MDRDTHFLIGMHVLTRNLLLTKILMLTTLLLSCGDYISDLPNGYRIARTSSVSISIAPPKGTFHPSHTTQGFVIGAHVSAYTVHDHWVVGYVVQSPESILSENERPGWFILNCLNHELEWGFSQQEVKDIIELRNLPIEVSDVRAPSRWR